MNKAMKTIFVLCAAMTVLASCGGQKKTVLEFMHSYVEEDRQAVIRGLIEEFQKANPGIEVVQVPTDEDAYWTKITTLMQGKKLPALIDVSVDQARLLASEGVVDTKACSDVIAGVGADKFYAGATAVLKGADGAYFGVPLTGWVQGIWYRTDWFAEKGLAAPSKWADILAAARAFHNPADKKYGILFASEGSDFTEQTFSQFALSNGADLFDASGKPVFGTSPAMAEAVRFYKELYSYSLPGSNGFTQVKDALMGGNAAMAVYSTYILGGLFDAGLAGKIGFAVPDGTNPASFGMISTEVITSTATPAQREAAVKFMQFLLTKDNYIAWMHMAPGGPNPVLKGIASDPAYLDQPLLKAFGATASTIPEAFENLRLFGFQNGVTHPKMGEISAKMVIPNAINNILVKDSPVAKELTEAQAQMEAIVAAK